jgi:hypothetical protein
VAQRDGEGCCLDALTMAVYNTVQDWGMCVTWGANLDEGRLLNMGARHRLVFFLGVFAANPNTTGQLTSSVTTVL